MGSVAAAIADLRFGRRAQPRSVQVSLEGATAFGCQAYMAKMDGLSKLDPAVKAKLKGMYFRCEIYTSEQYLDHITHADTDLLTAQSNGYRRMSANLYKTKNFGEFFHIHGGW